MGRPESDQGAVSKWELGIVRPPESTIVGIAFLGGLPLSHFMSDNGKVNTERRDMLIAAEWMDRMATELRERASAPSADRARGLQKALQRRPRKNTSEQRKKK